MKNLREITKLAMVVRWRESVDSKPRGRMRLTGKIFHLVVAVRAATAVLGDEKLSWTNEQTPARLTALSRSNGAADCTVTRDVNVNGGALSQVL
jgi:hypothetical protein